MPDPGFAVVGPGGSWNRGPWTGAWSQAAGEVGAELRGHTSASHVLEAASVAERTFALRKTQRPFFPARGSYWGLIGLTAELSLDFR